VCRTSLGQGGLHRQRGCAIDTGSLLNDHLELVSARNDPDLDEFQLQAIIKETPGAAQALLETEGYFTPPSGWRSRASISM
jgi:hypothetical protein